MNTNLKKILSIIAVILLGAIGSGLWESLLKPSLKFIYSKIITLIITISSTYESKLYFTISKGFHEMHSLSTYLLIMGIVSGFTICFFLVVVGLDSSKKKSKKNKQKHTFTKKWVEFLILIFFIVFTFSISFEVAYINDKITYFEQSYTIIAPYISHEEQLLIKSEFAQINDKDDYDRIISKIHDLAKENNITIKEYSLMY